MKEKWAANYLVPTDGRVVNPALSLIKMQLFKEISSEISLPVELIVLYTEQYANEMKCTVGLYVFTSTNFTDGTTPADGLEEKEGMTLSYRSHYYIDGEVRRHQEASLVTIRSSAGQWSVVSQTGRAFCAVSRVSIPGLITSYVVTSSSPRSIRCSSQVALYLTSGRSAFVRFPSIAMAKSCLRVYLPDDSKNGKRPSTTLTNLSGRPTTLTSKPKFLGSLMYRLYYNVLLMPLTLSSAGLKPILWDGGRKGERHGVVSQPTKVSFRANNNRWITATVDSAGYQTDLQRRSDIPDLAEVLRTVKQAWPSPRSCSLDRCSLKAVRTGWLPGGARRLEGALNRAKPSLT
uniref:Uncharacterized protein n=1 Tax=Timema shepardi TaxID=629360 RepID=A0A7R9FWF5_TIMSH|nr:unnamed protein product [Timema shepardi]